jgi:TolB protein
MHKPIVLGLLAGFVAFGLQPAVPAAAKVPGTNGQIVFAHNDPSLPDSMITTVNPDGSDPHQLLLGECPHWSPDGSVIASCGAPDGSSTMLINPDTASFSELFPPDLTLFLACAVWSPDGKRLACDQFDQPADPSRNGMYTIRSSDGGGIQRVTSNPGGEDIPGDYSPNGTQIVFNRLDPNRPASANTALFVVNVDGSGLRRITPWGLIGQDGDLGSWSPNGNWILFGAHGQLYLVHSDGTDLHTITLAGVSTRSVAFGPGWSPDGTEFVFALFTRRAPETGQEGIYTANANGTDVDQVTTATTFDDTPDWGTHPLAR